MGDLLSNYSPVFQPDQCKRMGFFTKVSSEFTFDFQLFSKSSLSALGCDAVTMARTDLGSKVDMLRGAGKQWDECWSRKTGIGVKRRLVLVSYAQTFMYTRL